MFSANLRQPQILCFLLGCHFYTIAKAEVFQDFYPHITLNELKYKYPNANFEDVKAACLHENEAFFKISGVGILGNVYVKFSRGDDFFRKKIKENQAYFDEHPDQGNLELKADTVASEVMMGLPLDEKLQVDWVRWVPEESILFDKIINRYGKPLQCGFSDLTYKPYCTWKNGINAKLSDDKKYVTAIEYELTKGL